MCNHGIGCEAVAATEIRKRITLTVLATLLSDAEIETMCRQLGHVWRDRKLPPDVTVHTMLLRALHADRSIVTILAQLAAAAPDLDGPPTDAAWCEARDRLPKDLWPALIDFSGQRLERVAGKRYQYHGHPVQLFDGSTLSMPDDPRLAEAFGRAAHGKGTSRFPTARLSVLIQAGSEAIVDYRLGPYRDSEHAHLHDLWDRIQKNAIVLWDKTLGSFYNLAVAVRKGWHVLCPLYHQRRPGALTKAGRRVGRNEWIVSLTLAPHLRRAYDDPALPQSLTVRLIRVRYTHNGQRRTLWLVTTLTDTRRYTRASLVRLYRKRWGIETHIRSLKITLQMAVLRSKTPHAIRSEVAATMLAHNLVWLLIHQAAHRTHTSAHRISFTAAVRTVLAFAPRLALARPHEQPFLYASLLDHIARTTIPHRPGRHEPRRVKRIQQRYPALKNPRAQARQTCLS